MTEELGTVVRPDGRRVAFRLLHDGSGPVVVLAHPAPGSASFDPDPTATIRRDIRLIGVDRPGYGRSDALPLDRWASVGSAADDLAAVIEVIGGAPVGVAGWSAGGRVVAALAAERPDLVARIAVIATPAPHDAVPWMPSELQAAVAALAGRSAADVRSAFETQMMPLAALPAGSDAGIGLLADPDVDAATLADDGTRTRLAAMMDAAFAQGVTGMAADVAGFTLGPPAAPPSAVAAKALLIYGGADPSIGSRHGRWWQRALMDARLEMVPSVGHLVIVPMWDRILSFLAPGTGRRP